MVAVRDDTGEFIRMRSGSSQRGHGRFVSETLARLRRLAPDAEVTVRADAGFAELLDLIETHKAFWSPRSPKTPGQNSYSSHRRQSLEAHARRPSPGR